MEHELPYNYYFVQLLVSFSSEKKEKQREDVKRTDLIDVIK